MRQGTAGLREFYRSQGRGRFCHVDYYLRLEPERHCYFAYPEDAVVNNWGNNGPLGRNANGNTDEVRAQILIPAHYLPPRGGTVVAIEVASLSTVRVLLCMR